MDNLENAPRTRAARRALLERKPLPKERGPRSPEDLADERARMAELQAQISSSLAAPGPPGRAMGKSVRGPSNKADKAGKVGKTGRLGRRLARAPKPKHKPKRRLQGIRDSRADVRGPGQGRGMKRGARGKSGDKERPPALRKRPW